MDTLRFYFVTWNVATKSPRQDLNALLDFPSQFNKNKPLPDFYVIGLQEVKSQPQNMVMDSLFTDSWTSAFNKILCRQGYIIAKSTRLQGILLLVYVQMKHITHLRDIEAQYTKTGLGGMWGNKGAVSIRFNIYGCSVCLVNSHLTAHEHLLAHRIDDYNTIIKQHAYHVLETSNILYHDYVFWMGDLNFRTDYPTDASPTAEEIVTQLQKIEKDKYSSLLRHDQLKAVMETGEAFSEFQEAKIRFPPTYKFNIGTDEYDLKRKPSWTDRVLYKVIVDNYENLTLRADLVSYDHMPHYTVSDHKPVTAQFNIKIRHGFILSLMSQQNRPSAVARSARAAVSMRSVLIPPADNPTHPDAFSQTEASTMSEFVEEFDDDTLPNTAFSNYTEKTAIFAPMSQIWYIGDSDYRTQVTLSQDVDVHSNDWIGIFDANFHNLDDYKAYEYVSKVSLPEHPASSGEPRTITLSFPVGSGVRTPGFYRFIYFNQPNNEVRSVLGISEPFEVSSKEDNLDTLAATDHPSTGASPSGSIPTTANTDVLSEFAGVDVAKLTRYFSNDLSID